MTANFFGVLGVSPFHGRLFDESDAGPGATAAAVVSHAFSLREFGSAQAAIGRTIPLNRTTFGRRTLAVGGNPEAARLAGIKVQRQTAYLYILVGLACGLAAVMLMARTTTGTSTHGGLYELDAIAAVVIGGTLLSGGRATIVGTVLGVLIFNTLTNVFTLNNLDTSTQAVAKGVIIVAAVLLQQRVAVRRGSP